MWQWTWFKGLAEQATKYGTFFGHVWHVVTFIFRLIVVLGLGSSVYGDEQGNFKCSAIGAGCQQACYNQFTQISHLRFWGFQLLAVMTPVVGFHFIAAYISSQLAKIKSAEEKMNEEERDAFLNDHHRYYEERKTRLRKKIVGKVSTKKHYSDGVIKEIPINFKIKAAYFISVACRLVAETVFLYYTYVQYNYPDYLCEGTKGLASQLASNDLECNGPGSGLKFLWATFPEIYPCRRLENSGVYLACTQNIAFNSVVPCWTSRAFEKTVFMRYMNILGAIGFVLCVLEILYIPIQEIIHSQRKRSSQLQATFYRNYPKPNDARDYAVRSSTIFTSHEDYSRGRDSASYYDGEKPRPAISNEPPPKKYQEYKA